MNYSKIEVKGLKAFNEFHKIDIMQLGGKCHCRQKTNEQHITLLSKDLLRKCLRLNDSVKHGKIPVSFSENITPNTLFYKKQKK